MEKATDWIVLALTVVLGGTSLIAFGVFLYAGPPALVDLELGLWGSLAIDASLSLLFFVQHSWMVRQHFRLRLARIVPEHFLDAAYAIASGIALLAVVLLWQESRHVIWQARGASWWASQAIFLSALVIGVWSGLSLKGFDTFGLGPIRRRNRAEAPPPPRLVVQGAYRWVRHPMYFVVLLMIWSYPVLTADRLMFNVLWTVWIAIGTRLEERDLTRVFGGAYTEYQQKVPMLLPIRIPGPS